MIANVNVTSFKKECDATPCRLHYNIFHKTNHKCGKKFLGIIHASAFHKKNINIEKKNVKGRQILLCSRNASAGDVNETCSEQWARNGDITRITRHAKQQSTILYTQNKKVFEDAGEISST